MKQLFHTFAVTHATVLLLCATSTAQILLVAGPQAPVSQAPELITTADFDRDGVADVAVTDPMSGLVTVFLAAGDGSFTSRTSFPVGHEHRRILASDLNCDGIPDLAVVDASSDCLFVLAGNGDGTFREPATYQTGSHPVDLVAGNFDGQGCTDIAVLNQTSGTVSVFLNLGNDRGFFVLEIAAGALPKRLAALDLDRRGIDDIITLNTDGLAVLVNDGIGDFATAQTVPLRPGAIDLAVGDFEGIDRPDILLLYAGTPAAASAFSLTLLLNRAHIVGHSLVGDVFEAAPEIAYPCPATLGGTPIDCAPTAVASGDLDSDGLLDFAVSVNTRPNSAGAASTPGLLLAFAGRGDGRFDLATQVLVGNDPQGIAIVDYNRYGSIGVAIAERGASTVQLLKGVPPPLSPPEGCRLGTQCLSGCCVAGACVDPSVCRAGLLVSSGAGVPDEAVTVGVTLRSPGVPVAGMQNDIRFGPGIVVSSCSVNPAINKEASAFALRQAACDLGSSCGGVMRALVLSYTSTDVITDGALLYTCSVHIGADTPPGVYPLTISDALASDPNGIAIGLTAVDGQISVVSPPGATPIPTWTATAVPSPTRIPMTPTPLPTATRTATLRPSVVLSVASTAGVPSAGSQVSVTLHNAGNPVAGVQADLLFELGVAIGARANGQPDCQVNPQINKNATGFAFLPSQCAGGPDCVGIRVLVLAVDNVDAIPDAAVLYSCTVRIAADTPPGTYALRLTGVVASDPQGHAVPAASQNGVIAVGTAPGATPIPTWTPAIDAGIPPAGPEPTPTLIPRAPQPTDQGPAIASRQTAPTDSSGCSVARRPGAGGAYALLVAVPALLWFRRQRVTTPRASPRVERPSAALLLFALLGMARRAARGRAPRRAG